MVLILYLCLSTKDCPIKEVKEKTGFKTPITDCLNTVWKLPSDLMFPIRFISILGRIRFTLRNNVNNRQMYSVDSNYHMWIDPNIFNLHISIKGTCILFITMTPF